MGPELIVAIVGPIMAGSLSLYVWVGKRDSERLHNSFNNFNTTLNIIERKMDDIRVDVAKNYVTNDDLVAHIKGEEEWHKFMQDELKATRGEIQDMRNSMDRIYFEYRDRHHGT